LSDETNALEVLEPAEPNVDAVLQVRDLQTVFHTEIGTVRAVDGVSFDVHPGEVLAVVGESGCGKTVTALSVLQLLPKLGGRIREGSISYRGENLVGISDAKLRKIRGNRISMIFQDPLTALNPVQRIGNQIAEIIETHRDINHREAMNLVVDLLQLVGIPNARERVKDYPHQFSGGMRQRAMIAMAIANDPDLLIADEPTTALDVTVQAQVLDVLLGVRERLGMAIMIITHDLGVVAEVAERVMVMYAGKKVEEGTVDEIFKHPKHPYTWGLLASTTRADLPRPERLFQIPGAPPSLIHPPEGCRFAARCQYAQPTCRDSYPDLRVVGPGHIAACHFAQEEGWESGPQAEAIAVRLGSINEVA
jgi:oligopeptide/dipeptide ABC transporter ATP-binding protein